MTSRDRTGKRHRVHDSETAYPEQQMVGGKLPYVRKHDSSLAPDVAQLQSALYFQEM